jgi:membrane-associated phospholipid phosphatase
MRPPIGSSLCLLVLMVFTASGWGQEAQSQTPRPRNAGEAQINQHSETKTDRNYDLQPGVDPENRLFSPFIKHIAQDQQHFWTLPAHARKKDLKWILPLAAATAGLIASDSWISKQVPNRPYQLNRSLKISDYSLYSLIGAGGGAFIFGKLSNNDHMRETGVLATEAAINATAATYAFKMATQRERPNHATGTGSFFDGGQSFPSEHSALAWSIASVLAHEYPGPLTKIAAYGLATAVTVTRVSSQQHFASDVVIGGALGWYFGHEVYRAHHDAELGGAAWGNYFEPSDEPKQRDPRNMSSPYVPPDSWVYPLFDRLVALGFVSTAYEGIRPWTRMECARLLDEAGEQIRTEGIDSGEGTKIYTELSREFDSELARLNGAANVGISVDSVYARATQISGTPLTDGYHFAQTITNDYGRPYGQGFNSISGFTAHAVAGPLSFALQGEYQHAPAVPTYSSTVQQAIANSDLTLPFPAGRPAINRFDLLNSTVAVQFHNIQLSAGKHSDWWSMTSAGPLLMSDNAEPILGLKLDNVSPYHIPLVSKIFGDVRSEYFLGRLDGHHFEFAVDHLVGPTNIQPQPFIQGIKLSFKPTQNLEFGFGFTAMFAGPGLPFTFSNFIRTFYSHTSGTVRNPGKRLTSFDFSYRIPGLRNWLTLYRDSLAVDEYTPLTSSRPSLNLGLYMPKLPKLNKADFRAEVIGTPHTKEFAPGFVYYGLRRYRDGYTNDGNILGSWIGRAGRGGQGWLTYWFSPRSTLQFGYRYQKVDRDFLQGGHLDDFSVRPQIMLGKDVNLSGEVQFEHWYFPLLSSTGRSNVTGQIQLTFFPQLRLRK